MAEAYPPSSTTASSSDHEESWLTKSGDEDDDEIEQVSVVSLFDETRVFPSAAAMLADCKERYGFDFLAVRDRLGLDFHGCVRLINLGGFFLFLS
jgi:protein arginine N-methyltransferase 3